MKVYDLKRINSASRYFVANCKALFSEAIELIQSRSCQKKADGADVSIVLDHVYSHALFERCGQMRFYGEQISREISQLISHGEIDVDDRVVLFSLIAAVDDACRQLSSIEGSVLG